MISKEDLKVVVVSLMQSGIDVMIICASIGCILHLEVLHKHEILDDFHVLDLSILAKERTN